VLETKVEKPHVLLRVEDGARAVPVPATPEPPPADWRDGRFDTD
jgi:hypothetical protein